MNAPESLRELAPSAAPPATSRPWTLQRPRRLDASSVILSLGLALVVLAPVLAASDVGLRTLAAGGLQWGVQCLAITLAWNAYRRGGGRHRSFRFWFLMGWLVNGAGAIVRAVPGADSSPAWNLAGQAISLLLGPCWMWGFWSTVQGRIRSRQLRAVLAEVLAITLALAMLALRLQGSGWPAVESTYRQYILVSSGMLALTAALGLLTWIKGRFKICPELVVMLVPLPILGACWTASHPWPGHEYPTGTSWPLEGFCLMSLLTALGGSRWNPQPSTSLWFRQFCGLLLRLLPLAAMIAAIGAATVPGGSGQDFGWLLKIGTVVTIILVFIRQSLLLQGHEESLVAEERLHLQTQFFNLFVEHTSDAVFGVQVETDGTFRYLFTNRTGRLMLPPNVKFTGQTPHQCFPAQFADQFSENYRGCVQLGTPLRYEQMVPGLTRERWVETTLVPIPNESGQVSKLLGITRDISAHKSTLAASQLLQKDLEKRVRQRTRELELAYQEMESFSYSVSHDLRAPLRGIRGFCDILLEEHQADLPPLARAQLREVLVRARQMGEIIDDLLSFSRIPRTPLRLMEVNLSLLAAKVARELQSRDPSRRAEWRIEPNLKVQGDLRLLMTALENLVGNAWKYSREQELSLIEVGQLPATPLPTFFVRDNGVGFDRTQASRLFEIFQRFHDPQEFEGTGIGLAIVDRIVSRHGGKVWAESRRNFGATFFFSIRIPDAPEV